MLSFFRNRLFRRFTILGRLADIALVAGILLRLAQRRGIVSDEQMAQFGLTDVSKGEPLGIGEMAMAGAAAWRLLRRVFGGTSSSASPAASGSG